MKPLVIYHANCADGFGAASAAWLKFGDDAEYVACSYGEELSFSGTWHGRDVYVLDFSFSRSVMEELFRSANRVVWLDHHKSAFEMWCPEFYAQPAEAYEYAETDTNIVRLHSHKSGAYLAWEYFHPGTEVPMFIQHIDDYDRWQFKIEGTKAFQKALWSYAPWSFEQWKEILGDPEADETFFLYTEGTAILRAHDQNVQSVVKGSARKVFLNLPDEPGFEPKGLDLYGLAANCPHYLTSDVGHELANQSGTFGLCWTLSQEGLIAKCSLRSNGEYDVSAIAKSFGGGGHRNAAGFEVDIQTLLGWLK